MSPRAWILTDAAYPGGAERYLEWILDAAGPDRLGIVAIARPGLTSWLEARRTHGFRVDALDPGRRVAEWRRFHAWCGSRRPEVLHVNLPGPYDALLASAPRLARLARRDTRVVVTEHLPGVGRVGKRYWWKRLGVGAVDVAIALCDAHAHILRQTFGYADGRVTVIPNGVPLPEDPDLTSEFASVARGDGRHLVQLGSLVDRKGGRELLSAVAALPDARPDLWFVGDGPDRAGWESLAGSLGLADRVHFVGHRPDAGGFLALADGVVLASHREGMPLSLLEAMARGRPVVATRVDGVPEIVDRETGWLVDPGDVGALTAALDELLAAEPLRRRKGLAARDRWHSRFRVERMVADTLATYGEGW